MKRRTFLEGVVVAGSVTGVSLALADTGACLKVPATGPGPMEPLETPPKENDLTCCYQGGPQAAGQRLDLCGKVLNQACEPISGAGIVIWQACASGVYNHPNESRNDWQDPNFRYEGHTVTDEQGGYLFHTILPGGYPVTSRADPGLGLLAWRAPHIHFTVTIPGSTPFTSQIFFDRFQDLNKFDTVLYKKTLEEKRRLTARVEMDDESRLAKCEFDIVV